MEGVEWRVLVVDEVRREVGRQHLCEDSGLRVQGGVMGVQY